MSPYLVAVSTVLATASAFSEQPTSDIVIPEEAPSDWEFRIEPYLWVPGLYGSTGIGQMNMDVDSSPGDVLESLRMAAALQFEVRNGRWGLLVDGFYAELGANGPSPGPIYDNVDAGIKQFLGELTVAYRVYESPRGFVDVYGGVRYNNLSLNMNATLDHAGISSLSNKASERIVDEITERAKEKIRAKSAEFKAANAGRRDEIASEISDVVASEAREHIKQSLVRKIERIRSDGKFDMKDVAISRIGRAVKSEQLELARASADLAATRIRAEVDAAVAGRVAAAEARVEQAKEDLSDAISNEIEKRVPTEASSNREWVDPIIGMRAQWNINDQWYLAGRSDVGGFGVGSDLAWSVQGTIGYAFNETISAEVGYRYFDTDYSDGDFSYAVAQHGVMLGVNFAF